MARKRDRAFAAFGAALFLLTSSALTIAVIISMTRKDTSKSNTAPQETRMENKLTGKPMPNFTPATQPQQQLEKIDLKPGTGQEVQPGDTVTAEYVGALMSNGIVFDASQDHGGAISFPLSGVIAGWSQGIPGMKVGGTRRLLIPASLGYGSQAQVGIPANSDLVFDVTITKAGK